MPVVTAGVHPPGMRRTERDAAFLFYGQRIHITAKSGGIRFARVKIGQHGTAARRNDPAAQRRQPIQQIGLSFRQLVVQLRNPVQSPSVDGELFQHEKDPSPVFRVIIRRQDGGCKYFLLCRAAIFLLGATGVWKLFGIFPAT